MDGQPLLLLFSVHVVYQFPPLAGAENRLLSPASPCGGFNSRAFYAELSGDMRISALKVRVLCSDQAVKRARKREKLSIGLPERSAAAC